MLQIKEFSTSYTWFVGCTCKTSQDMTCFAGSVVLRLRRTLRRLGLLHSDLLSSTTRREKMRGRASAPHSVPECGSPGAPATPEIINVGGSVRALLVGIPSERGPPPMRAHLACLSV